MGSWRIETNLIPLNLSCLWLGPSKGRALKILLCCLSSYIINYPNWMAYNTPPGDADMHWSGSNLRTTGWPTAPSSALPRTHSLPSAVSSLPLCSIFFSSSSTHPSSRHCPPGWLQGSSRRWLQLQPTLPQSSLHLETRTVFWEGKMALPVSYLQPCNIF